MNKLLIRLLLLVLISTGCSRELKNCERKTVYLSQDVFSKLKSSEVAEVYIVTAIGDKDDPAMWEKEYPEVFPIKDTQTIGKIIQMISDATKNSPSRFWGENIVFETKDTIYYTGISWSNSIVSGDWWESEELPTVFNSLGLTTQME